ncbi:hypothetical protein AGR4C_pc30132 [Agrobacterium tumefaciens str. Kerr 14]|uniref:Uncharacterized protein n=1 Tax=Agrobacterium tumefaciens str. Kerr 14 TaxID=1183424 RepID=A0A1S7SGF0_AGRTU|nr:hypothetical protein AGR4C_pc30132 [Agrobacterium tumefaciens str. Kerr 14]
MGMIGMVMIGGVGGLCLRLDVGVRVSAVRMAMVAGRDDVRGYVQSWVMRSQRNERIQQNGDRGREGGEHARAVVPAMNHAAIDNLVRIRTQETNLTHPLQGDR